MPCRYDDETPEEAAKTRRKGRKDAADKLAAFLCALSNILEDGKACSEFGYDIFKEFKEDNVDFAEWWKNHKEMDKIRKDKERESALKKLTDKEKRILGLK